MYIKPLLAGLTLLAAATAANAAWIAMDSEPNNTPPGSPLVSDIPIVNARFAACDLAADVGFGSLAVGGSDVDYYNIFLPADCVVTAITTPLSPTFTAPDTTLGAFGPGGGLLAVDDDSANGFGGPVVRGSAVQFVTPVAGVYVFAVSGFFDGLPGFDGSPLFDGFTGADKGGLTPHGEVGNYLFTVSVPEPATIGLLAAGLMVLARRRR
jgi:hypothetical protein